MISGTIKVEAKADYTCRDLDYSGYHKNLKYTINYCVKCK